MPSPTNGTSKWLGHILQAAAVIFAAGVLYSKVETVELAVGDIKEEIEPGILPRADERVRNLEKAIEALRAELRDKTQGRFYRWEADQLRKRIEKLEERIRVSP